MKRVLCILLSLLMIPLAVGAAAGRPVLAEDAASDSLPLAFAKNFRVDYCAGGAAHLQIGEEQEFLLVPEGAEIPSALAALPRIPIPVENVYLASSSVPDLFLQLDALDTVLFSSTAPEDWRIPELKAALENESILYAGKYSAPDYELLLTENCGLVVENTMILHSPAVKERLEGLGFPVLVEYSSYEPHPLGRVEWIKLYGLLTGKLPEAEAYFNRQLETFRDVSGTEQTGKTVAFFHITPNGAVVVRRKADYVTRMIELAGGESALKDLPEEENALSTVTIQMEAFYTMAHDADVLIYNSTVGSGIGTQEALVSLSPLLADFKAVRDGNVWCTEQSMFQRTSCAADMIADLHAVIGGESRELKYLYRIE